MSHIIGIDLGTTNSCVALVEGDMPVVIPNKAGYKTTPSVVAVSESGKRLVGQIAKRQAVTNATNTVYAAKRLIGRRWDSTAVRTMQETIPYAIVEGANGDPRVKLRDRVYSVPEVSSILLQEMKMIAEDYLGEPCEKAIITVPAYFNDAQRQATKDAGKIAGLDVVRIINEPTAAALAYGRGRSGRTNIAVYDLGGGTFDISILSVADDVFEVLATGGDAFLGGEDFDSRIVMDWLVLEFARDHQIDLRRDRMALQRLRDAAEKAKCELSMAAETEINLPFIISTGGSEALHLQKVLTREKLEELTVDLVERTIKICRKVTEEAGEKIDEVLLVGGMTRMPLVQQKVQQFFEIEPSKGVHPDEVVALGAAVQGHSLVGDDIGGALLLDVTPHSLGIMVHGGHFNVIIPKNTTIPTSRSHAFTTVKDNQTSVKILVMQGEDASAEVTELLGEFVLSGLRPGKAGDVEIEVKFDINADGIVAVSAKDLETDLEQTITVTASSTLSDVEVEMMIEENVAYTEQVKGLEAVESERSKAISAIESIEKMLPLVKPTLESSEFGRDALQKATGILERSKALTASKDLSALRTVNDSLSRTLNMFNSVASRLSAG